MFVLASHNVCVILFAKTVDKMIGLYVIVIMVRNAVVNLLIFIVLALTVRDVFE